MSCISTAQAAGPSNEDFFNRNTSASPAISTPTALPIPKAPSFAPRKPAQLFYDDLDNAIITHSPTDTDKFNLSGGFGHDFKKVAVWTNTAASVAHKYRELARILRNTVTPQSLEANSPANCSLAQYKSNLADWYDESAAWLEDYIKPRVACATEEELNTALSKMTDRSLELKQQHGILERMDTQLRDQFGARHFDDALWKYVSKKAQK